MKKLFAEKDITLLSGKNYDRIQNGIPICGKFARYSPDMGKSFDFQTLSQS
jgi:hypothetical protein